MAEELGKIEKLDIEQFGLRKLYVVPLIFSAPDAPPDYKEKLEKGQAQTGLADAILRLTTNE